MRTVAFIFLLLFSSSALADQLSAGLLYKFCNETDEVSHAACRFYILGVVEGAELVDGSIIGDDGRLRPKKKIIFCAPPNIDQSQLIDIFQKHMRLVLQSYPQDANLPAHSFVVAAMHTHFPCAK